MSNPPPVVYLFHGDDEYAIAQAVATLKARLGEAATVELNTSTLDPGSLSLSELETVVNTVPFLARRRMVILPDPLASLSGERDRERFLEILQGAPGDTAVVITVKRRLPGNHWLVRWAQTAGTRVYVKRFGLLKDGQMAGWIREQARELGGEFQPPAAALLGSLTGPEPRLAAQEIRKMLDYVNYSRPIEVDDVEYLFAPVDQEQGFLIFGLVDALGERTGERAARWLSQLLEVRDPLSLLGMIVRQFRLLLMVDELQAIGVAGPEFEKTLGVPGFVVGKLVSQARKYTAEELKTVMRMLLAIDEDIKTGEVDPPAALQILVAQLTSARSRSSR